MRLAAASLLLAFAAGPASAEVAVRVASGRVDLTATAAPLADVLDRLARQTGMKVVYEGPAPRQLVTVSLHGRTPAETVLAVFEGLGLNYAMVADASGVDVQTLMVAGVSTASAASTSTPAGGRATVGGARRPFGPPPGSSPESVEPAFEQGEEEADASELDFAAMAEGGEAAEEAGVQQPGGAPANVPPNALPNVPPQNPGAPPQGMAPAPTPPATSPTPFSASPFTPQPSMPFPPVPPGAPTGANPAPQGQSPGDKQQTAPPQ